MEINRKIKVEVVYADEHDQRLVSVIVDEGATIEAVVRLSGLLKIFPDIDLSRQSVGIFSRQRLLSDIVKEGDRVEIYRPLLIDPKEARRARAKQKKY